VLGGGDSRRTGPREDYLDLLYFFADAFERVEECRAGNDRRPVLVVVEDGNLHRLPQSLLDVEAIRRADVLEIDSADGGLEELAEPDHIFRSFGADFEIEDIEVGELLEEVALSFHYRFAGERSDVSQPQHCGAIRNHGDQISLRRVLVGVFRVCFYLETGEGDARRVGER
jgi:hypothetical protein